MAKKNVLLLLSGGKDSALCAEILQQNDYIVTGLCISGKQKIEEPGAQAVAQKLQFNLIDLSIDIHK